MISQNIEDKEEPEAPTEDTDKKDDNKEKPSVFKKLYSNFISFFRYLFKIL